MVQFYQNFKEILDLFQFKPEFIWNCDETMVNFQPSKQKVVSRQGDPKPIEEIVKYNEHITLLLFISAAGEYLKPLAILPKKYMPAMDDELAVKFHFAGQKSGWIDGPISEISEIW